jgi:hypothetical protein
MSSGVRCAPFAGATSESRLRKFRGGTDHLLKEVASNGNGNGNGNDNDNEQHNEQHNEQ